MHIEYSGISHGHLDVLIDTKRIFETIDELFLYFIKNEKIEAIYDIYSIRACYFKRFKQTDIHIIFHNNEDTVTFTFTTKQDGGCDNHLKQYNKKFYLKMKREYKIKKLLEI